MEFRVAAGAALGAILLFACPPRASAGDGPAGSSPAGLPELTANDTFAPVAPVNHQPFNDQRILKLIPDYQTVEDTSHPVAPLTARQKWDLAWKETIDPFNLANAVMTAGFSQRGNMTPKYGEGWANYGRRYGAAVGDFGLQNVFSAGVFATLLHQDPRYFRKGPERSVPSRVLYSVSRLFVCRNDAGRAAFNASNILGMSFGIAASNLYYPSASRTGTVMAARVETSLLGGVTGNLMSEFWPDIQRKFFRKRAKKS